MMRVSERRREWLISFALFAAILLALIVAVLLQAPLDTPTLT
jgi:hypothetical protein